MSKSEKDLDVKLNWLRAAVLGANDGIVSVAGVLMGVVGAGVGSNSVLLAGVAATVAGALSMGGGEYVSVSAQRDTELSFGRLKHELTANPWVAAWVSMAAFLAGALLPMLAAFFGPSGYTELTIVASVVIALAITGYWAAKVGNANPVLGTIRTVVVSLLTMGIAYSVGLWFGVSVL